ncbi:MAG: DinB family protein [Blastocatellia bacterium]|nr:DinB family protein [Blastocatellia bacterium]
MSSSHLTAFFEKWDKVHQQSINVMKTAPSEKFNWKPAGSDVSLGDLMKHIPQSELFLVGLIVGKTPSNIGLETLNTTEEVITAFENIHKDCKAALLDFPEDRFEELAQLGANKLPKKYLLDGICEHEIHHRGHLYTYIQVANASK